MFPRKSIVEEVFLLLIKKVYLNLFSSHSVFNIQPSGLKLMKILIILTILKRGVPCVC